MSSRTPVTTFKKLEDKSELGIVLGRLILAVNDIGIANDSPKVFALPRYRPNHF